MANAAHLKSVLDAWGTPGFRDALKREIECMDADQLPLQAGLTTGSYADAEGLRAMILGVDEGEAVVRVRAGLFYYGVIAGCNCADDPTPVDRHSEYCEVQLDIDMVTGSAQVALLLDD